MPDLVDPLMDGLLWGRGIFLPTFLLMAVCMGKIMIRPPHLLAPLRSIYQEFGIAFGYRGWSLDLVPGMGRNIFMW